MGVNINRIELKKKGAWSSANAYNVLDVVTDSGKGYYALKSVPAGTLLSNTEYWKEIDADGDSITGIWGTIIGDLSDQKDLAEKLDEIETNIAELEADLVFKRYGVKGIGQSASALTRLYDAVGMTAQVGTDGDNSAVVNDFDTAAPWQIRKCVGDWSVVDGRAKFTVNAYYGDADYAEDGTNGDYVAVEYPLSFYSFDGDTLVISSHKYPGFRAFDIFCRDHDQNNLIEKYYRNAYSLGVKDGKGASLPGLDNEQGNYKALLDKARTYKNGALGQLAILQPFTFDFYEWALYTVEFAQQNCQSVMHGCGKLRHENADTCKFLDATHVVVGNHQAARVAGEYVAIIGSSVDRNNESYQASHKIVSVTQCDSDGTPNPSGTCDLVEIEDLGKSYYDYDLTGATSYRFVARPWRTGECADVSTPSGSPISNSNGYYPCKYRWHENPFGNQHKTVADLFAKREGTGDSDYYLDWYLLLKPEDYEPESTSNPDATDLASNKFRKLGVQTLHDDYVNGYIKSKKYDSDIPDIWIPFLTTGGSESTYFADYAYLVYSHVVRSVRLGGHWYNAGYDGFSFVHAHHAPSSGNAIFGGDLCFIQ